MVRKVASRIDKQDPTLEVTALPVTEGEVAVTLPVIEAEAEAEAEAVELPIPESETPTLSVIEDHPDEKTLELRITNLEDKVLKLQTELTVLGEKKKKKGKKDKKDKKESKKKM